MTLSEALLCGSVCCYLGLPGCIILQNMPGCALRVSQHKRLADDGILCPFQFLVMTQRGQSVLKDVQFKIFLLSFPFPEPKY